ncbi:uncharacterized protein LOC117330127 [Pecten maximus]|uniref:uncharacterized protein LOC117330127 n=1 Tax=Pecten maximus TaxID=6579 RepID=UPI001458624B|nr:uncharacterized protein LOC117330127 [Pecten maximus]
MAPNIRRLTSYLRQRIASLHDQGLRHAEIVRELLHNDNISVSYNTVQKQVKLYQSTGVLEKPCQKKMLPRKLSADHMDYINMSLKENNELTGADLVKKLHSVFGISVSKWTVLRARKHLGWKSKSTQYCQTIRKPNKVKRLDYAIRCAQTKEQFENVIFTDESTIKIQTTTRKSLYKEGTQPVLVGKPKHPYQVHVWAGISRKGATNIHVFTGRMDSLYYQEILSSKLAPFINTHFPSGHRLMQDNDPKHVSKSTVAFMK